MGQAFAVWLTGLPASGKSAIARELRERLSAAGLSVEVLESDEVRKMLTPVPTYSLEERDVFYRALAFLGSRLVQHGVPVILDATATKRAYRDLARSLIPQFIEVAVVCPLEICRQRDQKGTYRKGVEGLSRTVPGLQDTYEPPLHPELTVDTTQGIPREAADRVFRLLQDRGYLSTVRDPL
jgi:adenylylsulfate kinase